MPLDPATVTKRSLWACEDESRLERICGGGRERERERGMLDGSACSGSVRLLVRYCISAKEVKCSIYVISSL